MIETIKLSVDLVNESECADLSVKLLVDNHFFYDNKVTPGTHSLEHQFEVSEGDHTFDIVLYGKNINHTQLDADGNIISDVLIKVTNIKFNDIEIDQLITEHAIYTHNTNSTSEQLNHKFYGVMGCNGTVTLNFTNPFRIWLLERM